MFRCFYIDMKLVQFNHFCAGPKTLFNNMTDTKNRFSRCWHQFYSIADLISPGITGTETCKLLVTSTHCLRSLLTVTDHLTSTLYFMRTSHVIRPCVSDYLHTTNRKCHSVIYMHLRTTSYFINTKYKVYNIKLIYYININVYLLHKYA